MIHTAFMAGVRRTVTGTMVAGAPLVAAGGGPNGDESGTDTIAGRMIDRVRTPGEETPGTP